MAVNTYFGSGKMTAIYLGSNEITKVYLGSNLVYTSFIPSVIPQIYEDFYVGGAVSKKFNNNTVNYYVGDSIQQI